MVGIIITLVVSMILNIVFVYKIRNPKVVINNTDKPVTMVVNGNVLMETKKVIYMDRVKYVDKIIYLDKIVDEVNKELTEKENLMVELKNLKNVKKKSPRQEQSISILEAVIDNMK